MARIKNLTGDYEIPGMGGLPPEVVETMQLENELLESLDSITKQIRSAEKTLADLKPKRIDLFVKLREKCGTSLDELAYRSGMHYATISREVRTRQRMAERKPSLQEQLDAYHSALQAEKEQAEQEHQETTAPKEVAE